MADDRDASSPQGEPPRYTRYRARPRLSSRREDEQLRPGGVAAPPRGRAGADAPRGARAGSAPPRGAGGYGAGANGAARWRRWATRKRIALSLVGLVLGWIVRRSHFHLTLDPRQREWRGQWG